jgi:hypothetical protein
VHRRRHGRGRPVRGRSVKVARLRYPFLHDDESGDVDLEITAQGLCFANDAGRSATIDWPLIRRVRLYCDAVDAPTPLFSRLSIPTFRYFCEITLRDKKRLVIVSGFLDEQGHWVGMGPPYRAFVEHLHDRLRANRSRARFRRGLTCYGFFNYVFGTSWPRLAEISGPGFWLAMPTDWPILVRHSPRRYRPDRLPQNLLPPF